MTAARKPTGRCSSSCWRSGSGESSGTPSHMPTTSCSSSPGPTPASITVSTASAAAWRDFLSAWEDFRVAARWRGARAAQAFTRCSCRLQARGKGSGVEIDAEVANVVHMRDGQITRLEMFWDRAAAIAAAGRTRVADRLRR